MSELVAAPPDTGWAERRLRPRSSFGLTLFDSATIADGAHRLREYQVLAFVSDVVVVLGASLLGVWLRFGLLHSRLELLHDTRVSYRVAVYIVAVGWLLALAAAGAYDEKWLGNGTEELKRVLDATLKFFAAVGLLCFLAHATLARGYLVTTLVAGTSGLFLSRCSLRLYAQRLRARGCWTHRVVAVGTREAVCELVAQTRAEPSAGLRVVGVCLPEHQPDLAFVDGVVPVVGTLDDVVGATHRVAADLVAVTRATAIGSAWLTRLAWSLHGSGVRLAVAPALTNVAGPRIAIRAVAGLPLLHVEEPELTSWARMVKAAFGRLVAVMLLLLFAPLMAAIAVAIRVDSHGRVLFRQQRVGQHGRPFLLFKFRSMLDGAAAHFDDLAARNEADPDGVLFKIRHDPRVTRIGRWLRRYSLDELPQLLNVIRGEMALVGPRPPLPSEVDRYGEDARRRLLVKPGITGLWQVSGRSDLSWEDTVRLDLFYVENWSLALDLQILARTFMAIVRGRGAY